MYIRLEKSIAGSILDIGGGGEGIIGRLYRKQVTAIDIMQEELDEAPDCCKKLLMDARNLSFPSNSFDNVTAFYSLMFMLHEDQEKVVSEAARVLRSGGHMYIWDAVFQSFYPEPFVVNLEIDLGSEFVHTSYGVVKDEAQSDKSIIRMANDAGLILSQSTCADGQFYLTFEKIKQAPELLRES